MRHPLRILIDGPNVAHGLRHALRLTSNAGRPTGVLMGWIKTLSRLIEEYNPAEIVVVWETQVPSWRYPVFPKYKAARRAKQDQWTQEEKHDLYEFFEVQLPDTIRFLHHVGVAQIAVPALEADDILGWCVQPRENDPCRYLVVSTDKDMLQLTQHNRVRVYNAYAGKLYHQRVSGELVVTGAENKTLAPSPETYLLWRAIEGDTSDSIPGVPGVGSGTIQKLYGAQRWDTPSKQSVAEYLNNVELRGKRGEALRESESLVLRNLRLMRLGGLVVTKNKVACSFIRKCKEVGIQKPIQLPTEFPLYLAHLHKDPSPFLNFFRKRSFDFAYYPTSCEILIKQYRRLYQQRQRLCQQNYWQVPMVAGKHTYKVTP